mmetsp:Transcript_12722/g.19094  ORF Transcript_12722/g.19094 Transcript_12722/m.19094 type:complete len:82 (+) Transcript_12722:231-476(+)
MLLAASPDGETGNIHQLGANADVPLTDENTCMVDALGKPLLVHLRLKTTLQKLLSGKLKDGIQLQLTFLQKSVAGHTTKEG